MNQLEVRQGSAHVIIIVSLVVILLSALGFVFWQHFIAAEKSQTETKEDIGVAKEAAPSTYTGSGYTFQYPATGWIRSAADNNSNFTNDLTIQTGDYAASTGVGIEKGALISVNVNSTNDKMLDARIEEYRAVGYYTDIRAITVAGFPAYSYVVNYEGTHYRTEFDTDTGLTYTIGYDEAEATQDTRSVYEDVVASFDVQ